MIKILSTKHTNAENFSFRSAEIIIGNAKETYRWRVGGLPVDGDLLPILQSRYDELFIAAKNGGEVSDAFTPTVLVTEILAALESAFWQFAKQFTGEPEITQLKLKNWQDKYALALRWSAAGKPDVTKEPELYAPVILEAGKRVNLTDPNELIASWLKNGYVWERLLNWYYQEYEPAERGRAYAAQAQGDIEALQGILDGLEERLGQAAIAFINNQTAGA